MALLQRANSYSPASSLSESSFSVLTSTPSSNDPFEAIDDSSSDEDEIVWTANELDPEEDFILVPYSRLHSDSAATLPREAETHPLREALTRLSVQDQDGASATPTPTKSTLPSSKSKLRSSGSKGRRSAGARSEVTGQSLALTAPTPAPKIHRGRKRRGKKDESASYPSPSPSPERDVAGTVLPSSMGDTFTGRENFRFGAHPLVEESDGEYEPTFGKYEDAVSFITSFLSNPSAALSCSTYTRLMFLQSLIIELGLMSPSSALPASLTSAKRLLKSRAFINIRDYLSAREQGLDRLQEVMFNSKRELTIELRKKKGGRKADKGWVKRHGLNVLLVSVF